MDSITSLRRDLLLVRSQWTRMAEDTAVNPKTIQRIASGSTPNPRIGTYDRLRTWLDRRARSRVAA